MRNDKGKEPFGLSKHTFEKAEKVGSPLSTNRLCLMIMKRGESSACLPITVVISLPAWRCGEGRVRGWGTQRYDNQVSQRLS
jgi:hypothetical protein